MLLWCTRWHRIVFNTVDSWSVGEREGERMKSHVYSTKFSDCHFHDQLISTCLLSFYLYSFRWVLLRPPMEQNRKECTCWENANNFFCFCSHSCCSLPLSLSSFSSPLHLPVSSLNFLSVKSKAKTNSWNVCHINVATYSIHASILFFSIYVFFFSFCKHFLHCLKVKILLHILYTVPFESDSANTKGSKENRSKTLLFTLFFGYKGMQFICMKKKKRKKETMLVYLSDSRDKRARKALIVSP